MSNEKYELLMREMDSIAKKLERFPESLKESAFNKMVEALLVQNVDEESVDEKIVLDNSSVDKPSISEEREEDRGFSTLVRDFYDRASGSTCNDMEFSTLSAYFFETEAPSQMKRRTIGPDDLERMCRITRRRVPANCRSTLNNAKNHKAYLKSDGKGLYLLTEDGRKFVKGKLSQLSD
ncbi:MAG: hypothetical protein OXI34_00565 [Chloroflexota bacterium]|nr:hypothetical protein [Chloroflexota bacterium]MDE2948426.1 hypothetical protein [Chloroflexota bacterium]